MEDGKEKDLWKQAQELLEKETLLCDHNFNEEEKAILRNLSLATFKPSLARGEVGDLDGLIKELMQKAGIMLFFTVCEKEARAWELRKGSTILEAAGKIHTDLAKGFIKADVVCCKDLDSFFNMAEARAKGFVRVVDKDYIMEEGNIIEIRFSI
jgi:ribosome-binding ATPase YchF (GTP1/OBG family)